MRKIIEVSKPTIKEFYTYKVLDSLNDWFEDKSAVANFSIKSRDTLFFISDYCNHTEGFISIKIHNEYSAEIYVMGVYEKYQSSGIGSKLLRTSEKRLTELGYKYMQVKTLGPFVECDFYKSTRMFYESNGYVPLEESREIWGKDNPCLIMIKSLQ